ncbi:MAG: YraN family protein [Firmicutes bacterium]|nr:YraN family protein [Bacillota bacterium]
MGALGEKIAAEYLREKKGYKIIARNYTCPLGELDLVAIDQGTIVFVEVRSGTLPFAGWAEESIGLRKQKKLRQLAYYFLKEKKRETHVARFDVVIVIFSVNLAVQEIKLIKDAF